ncbi:hypothetical protein CYJ37_08015 [Bacillus sp. UMB0728]|nr:hypothetical protein CYJ37_08015 [Bacillus sp. UMB0728]
MTRKRSLEQAFIKKYGENLNFSDTDMQEVLQKAQGQQQKSARKKMKFGPPLIMIAAPLIAVFLLLSYNILPTKENPDSPDTEKAINETDEDQILFGDIGIQRAKREGLFTKIDQTVEKDGTSITLHEFLYDGTRLAIVYSIAGENIEDKLGYPLLPEFNLSVDGKPYMEYSAGNSFTDEKDKYLYEFHLYGNLPEEFNLGINAMILGEKGTKMSFDFPVEKAGEDYYSASPNNTVENGEVSMTLNKVSFAPSGTQVVITMRESMEKYNAKNGSYVFEIKDQDDKGFAHLISGATGGSQEEGMFSEEFNEYYEPAESQPKSLTITPYLRTFGEASYNEKPLKEKLPFYLEQDSYGGVEITNVKQKEGEVWIYYQPEGELKGMGTTPILTDKSSGKSIRGINQKAAEGYVVKFKTPLGAEELMVSVLERNITKLEGLELQVDLD